MFQDRWYQTGAVNAVFDYYYQGYTGNPVIALPTGTGKSIVIARLNQQILQMWPGQRLINLTHVKELVEQNSNKLIQVWPDAPIGIYSAGLKQRDTDAPIIFGGIQSAAKCPEAFGHRDIAFVDEAHLVNPKATTQYQTVFAALTRINPNLKIVGLSASPYRLGQGYITDGGLFTDICYNQCGLHEFNTLVDQGFISPLVPKATNLKLDIEGVATNSATGDYAEGQLQAAVDKDDITYAALCEVMAHAQDRHCWMVFCAGVEHSEHVADMLTRVFNVPSVAIHSRLSSDEVDRRFADFKAGKYRCITGMNKFTTGFDHPPIDLIIMLRPTKSPVLWVQMLGRGTRPYDCRKPGDVNAVMFNYIKTNCLVLDFAANTASLGPINDPIIPKAKGKGGGGTAPVRKCEQCNTYNHARATHCSWCNEPFMVAPKIEAVASSDELIRKDPAITEWFDVKKVVYQKKTVRASQIPMLVAIYYCAFSQFRENVMFEHQGLAKHHAHEWWRQRSALEVPVTVDEAMQINSELRPPKRIEVWTNKQYPEITRYEF